MVSTICRSYRHAAISLFGMAAFFIGTLGCTREPPVETPAETQPRRSEVSEQTTALDPSAEKPAAKTGERGPGELVSRLSDLVERQRIDEAQRVARAALVAYPSHPEILFLAARTEAAAGRLEVALELLAQIPPKNRQAKIAALGTGADWLVEAGQLDRAIPKYEAILRLDPGVTMAHRQLASLLNRLGRRQQAIGHLQALCRAGDITQAELASMISRRDPSRTSSETTPSRVTSASSSSATAGRTLAARARQLLTDGEHQEAISILIEALESARETAGGASAETSSDGADEIDPVAVALLGRASADAGDPEGLRYWWRYRDRAQRPLADHWYALGALAQRHLDAPGMTADLLAEAVIRDPTDWVAYGLLENVMNRLERDRDELFFKSRVIWLKRTIRTSNRIADSATPSAEDIDRMANLLDHLGRPLEATMWRALGAASHPRKQSELLRELQQRHQQLVASGEEFTTVEEALGGYPRHDQPAELRRAAITQLADVVPALQSDADGSDSPNRAGPLAAAEPAAPSGEPAQQSSRWRFLDQADNAGLQFQYHNAWPAKPRDLQIYEQFGGGVAALDYDLDGCTDLYFGQAAGSPNKQPGQRPNMLYAARGNRFVDVTAAAGVDDRGYGLGVTAGDVNQDGFDDLVVCNFGSNTLLINNGDGTYRRASAASAAWQHEVWTASAAIGDINADGLPDVVEVNYLDDPRVFEVPPRNAEGRFTTYRGPESYRAAADRILYQRPDGSWRAEPLQELAEASPGLGVVVADFDRSGDNDVFIANDTEPNQLWRRKSPDADGDERLVDVAKVLGCAYSAQGGSGASMGVAAADFDRNGRLDLHVTNFYHEPVHLYLQSRDGIFVDSAVGAGLYADSMPVLGFGTTTLDVENEGQVDLAVVNGHIEDLRFRGAPYKMRPQLFRQHAGRFQLLSPGEVDGEYFSQSTIGRGLIRLDWNRDGRVDLVATHHDAPAALLENQSQPVGRWLQLRLVGTSSERSSIGAVVTVETDRGSWTQWVTSGDGYSCRDSAWLFFGLGNANEIKAVTVDWPGGSRQRFENVPRDRRVLLIQGQPAWPLLSRSAAEG